MGRKTILMVTTSTAAAACQARASSRMGFLQPDFCGEKDNADVSGEISDTLRSKWRGRGSMLNYQGISSFPTSNEYYPFALLLFLNDHDPYSFDRSVIDPSFRRILRRGTRRTVLGFCVFGRPAGRHHFGGLALYYWRYENRSKRIGLVRQCLGAEASPSS